MTTVYGKLNNLLTAANATTGESDTTLTDAVQTLIDGYGGGGGGIFTKLLDDTLTENVRSYNINIQEAWRNYDILIIYVKGEFTASDWLYWNIDATTLDGGKYSSQRKQINDPYIISVAPAQINKAASLFWQGNGTTMVTSNIGSIDMSTLNYFWISGYSKDIAAGTRVVVYGCNYADL